jgi:endoglucanase
MFTLFFLALMATLTSCKNFVFFGVNESGAEFAETTLPGVAGKDFTFPNTSAIDVLMTAGMTTFRIPFLAERMAPQGLTGALDGAYLANLTATVTHITSARNNSYAVIDSHNYGRYQGSIITSTSDFKTYWTQLGAAFANNSRVVFDCNNEFHDMGSDATLVPRLNQACIDGVRAAGATSQYVFVEGTSYTGAWTWTSSGNAATMGNLTDPQGKIVYEMHQYLDSDGSGTHDECINATTGAARIQDGASWLKANGKKGILGEFAAGNNDVCKQAVKGLLQNMANNTDVWMGAMWWSAGPFVSLPSVKFDPGRLND